MLAESELLLTSAGLEHAALLKRRRKAGEPQSGLAPTWPARAESTRSSSRKPTYNHAADVSHIQRLYNELYTQLPTGGLLHR